jgi:hypothetical protein
VQQTDPDQNWITTGLDGAIMRKARMKVKSTVRVGKKRSTLLEQINFNAAGIDVGSREHWVAVPADRQRRA